MHEISNNVACATSKASDQPALKWVECVPLPSQKAEVMASAAIEEFFRICSMFCCTLLYVHSSIAIILMGKRELIALLNLSSWCLVMVERLFLAVPRGCLQFVIVVFPDHTHLLFLVVLCSYSQIKDGTLRASYLKHYVVCSKSTRQEQLNIGLLLMAKVSDLTEHLWMMFGVF